ncbi:hypothetical protein POJ06DRAFT_301617 [Lipomyces tetrasporus]|uniref:Uncharacterized protein n=1 Tax=Lipomyces tetrasporus TaxID=54092 RepID=A0AAD7QQU2_9ASCO|nr:uncharacterized protein POJ06DRAFT_301617 [Lipomyces tetrasporus]KAJ8099748.1 hypothetical protein POJ06DRAFT_301617 [Lipomyces tetrasporus]
MVRQILIVNGTEAFISPNHLIKIFDKFDNRMYFLDDVDYYNGLSISTSRVLISIIRNAPSIMSVCKTLTAMLCENAEIRSIVSSQTPHDIRNAMMQLDQTFGVEFADCAASSYVALSYLSAIVIVRIISRSMELRDSLSRFVRRFVAVVLMPVRERKDHWNGVMATSRTPYLLDLKRKVINRDSDRCQVSGKRDIKVCTDQSPTDYSDLATDLKLIPIIPPLAVKSATFDKYAAILTDGYVSSENLTALHLLSPTNWMLCSRDVIDAFVRQDIGIVASPADHEDCRVPVYRVERLNLFARLDFVCPSTIAFGKQLPKELPSPHYCNLITALAKITHESGASAVIDQLTADQRQILKRHSYLNGNDNTFTILENKLLDICEEF